MRGLFVHPGQVAEVLRRHSEIGRARLVLSGDPGHDRMVLQAEAAGTAPSAGLAERLVQTLRDVTRLRGEIEWLAPGALPNDGRAIVDERAIR